MLKSFKSLVCSFSSNRLRSCRNKKKSNRSKARKKMKTWVNKSCRALKETKKKTKSPKNKTK